MPVVVLFVGIYLIIVVAKGKASQLNELIREDSKNWAKYILSVVALYYLFKIKELRPITKYLVPLVILGASLLYIDNISSELEELQKIFTGGRDVSKRTVKK